MQQSIRKEMTKLTTSEYRVRRYLNTIKIIEGGRCDKINIDYFKTKKYKQLLFQPQLNSQTIHNPQWNHNEIITSMCEPNGEFIENYDVRTVKSGTILCATVLRWLHLCIFKNVHSTRLGRTALRTPGNIWMDDRNWEYFFLPKSLLTKKRIQSNNYGSIHTFFKLHLQQMLR